MKTVLKKLNREAGFTLSEMLIAVVILVLITSSVLPAAVTAYKNAVDAANAQVLLSTTVSALRNELSMAWDVKTPDDTTITYKSSNTGSRSIISIEDNKIMLQEYALDENQHWYKENDKNDAPKTNEKTKRPLVSAAMRQTTRSADEQMKVTYSGVSYSQGYVTISGLTVKRGETVIAKMPETGLLIRAMTGNTVAENGGESG